MSRLYVSTDAFEAEELVDPQEEKDYKYEDIDARTGKLISQRIGFNPMSYVELRDSSSSSGVEKIAKKLVKEGLFVSFESNGKITKYQPSDLDIRNELVKLALRKEPDKAYVTPSPAHFILMYSNNPHEIKKEIPVKLPL